MVLLGTATLPGSRYGSLNQDYVLAEALQGVIDGENPSHIAIVMDGHGMLGEAAAREAGEAILENLKCSFRSTAICDLSAKEVESIFTNAFLAGHNAALRVYEEPPSYYVYPKAHSTERRYTLGKLSGQIVYRHPVAGARILELGTTATAVVVQGRSLAVAHVGDSLVALGTDEGDTYGAVMLTDGHNGADKAERERLEQAYGDTIKFKGSDGYLYVPSLPGIGGAFSLAMTRALGHRIMQDYGVIPTPTVIVRRLEEKDVCLIAASDGVWEAMTAREVVVEVTDALADGRDANSAAHALCTASVKLVKACGRHMQPDNTTAALLVFDKIL